MMLSRSARKSVKNNNGTSVKFGKHEIRNVNEYIPTDYKRMGQSNFEILGEEEHLDLGSTENCFQHCLGISTKEKGS